MDKTNIYALVQSIERYLHLVYKNIFSIKQNQFLPKIGLNLFKESRRTSRLCVRRRLRLYIYPRRPEVMVGRDMGWRAYRQVCGQRGRNLTMTLAIHITYQTFSSAAARVMNTASVFNFGDFLARARKKWIAILDKSVVFAYDGVPAHLDLAIPALYVHSLCFLPRHR